MCEPLVMIHGVVGESSSGVIVKDLYGAGVRCLDHRRELSERYDMW